MELLKRLFLEQVTMNGEKAELTKAEFYKRASRIYLNREEMRQVLKELHNEGDIALKQQAQKVLFTSPVNIKGKTTFRL